MSVKLAKDYAFEHVNILFKEGARKRPFSRKEYFEEVLGLQLKGQADVLDEILNLLNDEAMTIEEKKGEVHLMRQQLWNQYVKEFPNAKHKPISLEQAMQEDPWGSK
jgi:hypothetical protein